ncbi:hypothetical protein JVU11DRAFT_7717 [Chiua virens]|nr:hypothetical protein JVU11DRAFT_7717 [Chiua virens]
MAEYGPQPLHSSQLLDQYTMGFEGDMLSYILYGVYVIIAGASLPLLRRKRSRIFLSFTVFQLTITTLYIAMLLYSGPAQLLAIFGLFSANGPDSLSPWNVRVVNALFLVNTLASDGFILYRCYVVCSSNKSVVALPTLTYVATVGASIAWLVVDSIPRAVYNGQGVQVAGTAALSCSVAMNITTSVVVSARLLFYRRTISQAVGSQQGQFYLSYMAMMLESTMLYTVFSTTALIFFAINSPLFNVFFPVLGIVQAISPSLIVYRIARGFSVKTDGHGNNTVDTLRFASDSQPLPLRAYAHSASDVSGTMQVSLGCARSDLEGSNSFMHEFKPEQLLDLVPSMSVYIDYQPQEEHSIGSYH